MPTLKKSAKKTAAKTTSAKSASKPAAKKATAMPTFSKAPPELVTFFRQMMAGLPMAETRTMFGYPAGFASGQMFACLFADNVILRLAEVERAAFIQRYATRRFEPSRTTPLTYYRETINSNSDCQLRLPENRAVVAAAARPRPAAADRACGLAEAHAA